jgi:hypothetical protein
MRWKRPAFPLGPAAPETAATGPRSALARAEYRKGAMRRILAP